MLPSRDRVHARRTPSPQARLRTVVLLGASLAGLGVTVSAAELQQATIDAFTRYVKATEARHASSAPFLWFEGLAQAPRSNAEERLRRG